MVLSVINATISILINQTLTSRSGRDLPLPVQRGRTSLLPTTTMDRQVQQLVEMVQV